MIIKLSIMDKEIDVTCRLRLKSNQVNFKLAKSLSVDGIRSESGEDIPFRSFNIFEELLPDMLSYELKGRANEVVEIRYHGPLEGRFLYMDRGLIHFSFYNVWYPIIYNYFEYEVEIEDIDA